MKEIKLLYLYPDMLELYGDYGNIQVLKYRMEKRGINLIVDKYTIGDKAPDFTSYDIVFAGGGADNEQSILSTDLIKYKDNIKKAVESKVFFLLICGSYQLFGKYYKGVEGNVIPGLEVFNYYTVAEPDRKKRCIGNIVLDVKLNNFTKNNNIQEEKVEENNEKNNKEEKNKDTEIKVIGFEIMADKLLILIHHLEKFYTEMVINLEILKKDFLKKCNSYLSSWTTSFKKSSFSRLYYFLLFRKKI